MFSLQTSVPKLLCFQYKQSIGKYKDFSILFLTTSSRSLKFSNINFLLPQGTFEGRLKKNPTA